MGAMLLLIVVAMPLFPCSDVRENGLPFEKVAKTVIRAFSSPEGQTYKTENLYEYAESV